MVALKKSETIEKRFFLVHCAQFSCRSFFFPLRFAYCLKSPVLFWREMLFIHRLNMEMEKRSSKARIVIFSYIYLLFHLKKTFDSANFSCYPLWTYSRTYISMNFLELKRKVMSDCNCIIEKFLCALHSILLCAQNKTPESSESKKKSLSGWLHNHQELSNNS